MFQKIENLNSMWVERNQAAVHDDLIDLFSAPDYVTMNQPTRHSVNLEQMSSESSRMTEFERSISQMNSYLQMTSSSGPVTSAGTNYAGLDHYMRMQSQLSTENTAAGDQYLRMDSRGSQKSDPVQQTGNEYLNMDNVASK